MNESHMPTIDELDCAPELAVLAALDSTLEAATRSLLSAYPELSQDDVPRYRIESVIRVSQLLAHASTLQVALARYREAVLRENA